MVNRKVSIMRIWAACLILITSFVFISPSRAALVSYAFTAERSLTLGAPSSGSVAETAAGIDLISGTFSFESSTLNDGFFIGDFATGTLIIDQFSFPAGGTSNITTTNNFIGSDALTFTHANGGLRAVFQLIDMTETLLSSLDLPLFLFLTDLVSQIRIADISAGTLGPTVFYDLTSLTAVPLPSALPMMLGTLIGVAWIVRRRKKVTA